MLLKDYEEWLNTVYNYWSDQISQDSNCTSCMDTLNTEIDNFKTTVENLFASVDKDLFLKALVTAETVYNFRYCTDYMKYKKFEDLQDVLDDFYSIPPHDNFELPDDVSGLFKIVTNSDTGKDELDTTNFDNLLSQIQTAFDNLPGELKDFINTAGSKLFKINISITKVNLQVKKVKCKEWDKFQYYLNLIGIDLPYVNS